MPSRTISARNLGCLIALLAMNSLLISGFNRSGHDMWITMLVTLIAFFPLMIITCRIAALHPGRGLFEILEILCGKWIGRILTVLLVLFGIGICSINFCIFAEFLQETAFHETPFYFVAICMALVGIYLANSGMENIGKWALGVTIAICVVFVVTVLLSINLMDVQNLLPLVSTSKKTLLEEGLYGGMICYGESFFVLAFCGDLKRGDSPYKAYGIGYGIGFVVMIVTFLRNVLILGGIVLQSTAYPPYVIARIIKVGEFLEHIEIVVSFIFIFLGITKVAVYLRFSTLGLEKLLHTKAAERKYLNLPVAFFALALCVFVFTNVVQFLKFVTVYFYLATPFLVVLPVVLWILSEVRHERQKKAAAPETAVQPQQGQ
ncbi:MAG: endospore germination permease [Oscillospiraceae bacterium]|nr:endospore germination permease [Oscillospiraceae bacterium]